MKKYLLIALAICMSLSLTACDNNTNEDINPEVNIQEEEKGPYENKMEYKWLDYIDLDIDLYNKDLSDTDIIKAYTYATAISNWFNVSTIKLDYETQVNLVNDHTGFEMPYAKAANFHSYDEFKNIVKYFFDEKIANEYLASPSYKEYEGQLYGCDAGRGTDIFAGDDTYKIERINENEIIIHIAQEYYNLNMESPSDEQEIDHYNYFDFTMVYNNGWHFTTFPVIR